MITRKQHGRKIAEQMLEGTGITFDDILAHYKMNDIKSEFVHFKA